jgi:ubiquitin-protein ligase
MSHENSKHKRLRAEWNYIFESNNVFQLKPSSFINTKDENIFPHKHSSLPLPNDVWTGVLSIADSSTQQQKIPITIQLSKQYPFHAPGVLLHTNELNHILWLHNNNDDDVKQKNNDTLMYKTICPIMLSTIWSPSLLLTTFLSTLQAMIDSNSLQQPQCEKCVGNKHIHHLQ